MIGHVNDQSKYVVYRTQRYLGAEKNNTASKALALDKINPDSIPSTTVSEDRNPEHYFVYTPQKTLKKGNL